MTAVAWQSTGTFTDSLDDSATHDLAQGSEASTAQQAHDEVFSTLADEVFMPQFITLR
jgi:hypothetical protein